MGQTEFVVVFRVTEITTNGAYLEIIRGFRMSSAALQNFCTSENILPRKAQLGWGQILWSPLPLICEVRNPFTSLCPGCEYLIFWFPQKVVARIKHVSIVKCVVECLGDRWLLLRISYFHHYYFNYFLFLSWVIVFILFEGCLGTFLENKLDNKGIKEY